jgi:hypothetical protein
LGNKNEMPVMSDPTGTMSAGRGALVCDDDVVDVDDVADADACGMNAEPALAGDVDSVLSTCSGFALASVGDVASVRPGVALGALPRSGGVTNPAARDICGDAAAAAATPVAVAAGPPKLRPRALADIASSGGSSFLVTPNGALTDGSCTTGAASGAARTGRAACGLVLLPCAAGGSGNRFAALGLLAALMCNMLGDADGCTDAPRDNPLLTGTPMLGDVERAATWLVESTDSKLGDAGGGCIAARCILPDCARSLSIVATSGV